MVTILLLLLIVLIGIVAYLIYSIKDVPYTVKKKGYQRKPMVKRMPTAMLVVHYATGVKVYPISGRKDGFYIGSGDQCDLKIPKNESEYIDLEHALISYDEYTGDYTICDLDSMNGIYNQDHQRVTCLALEYGMQLWLANILMEYLPYDSFTKGVR